MPSVLSENKYCQEKILDKAAGFMYDSVGDGMEKIVEQTLLYDFYGELLTAHQKLVYEAVIFNDMSLSEIAQEQGISRQGVHDLIKRCNKILQDYEAKLHLVERFVQAKKLAEELNRLTREYETCRNEEMLVQMREISQQITQLI